MPTNDQIEKSVHDALREELYEFSGPSASFTYRFASADRDLSHGGNTYTSCPLLRTEIALAAGGDGEEIRVEMPIKMPDGTANPLLAEFAWKRPPRRSLNLIVYRRPSPDGTFEQAWEGKCHGFVPGGGGSMAAARSPSLLNDALRTAVPAKAYNPQCGNRLGDTLCRVDLEPLKVNTTISSITGNQVVVASIGGKPANYFTNGTIKKLSDSEERDIQVQTGATTTLTLFETFVALAPTDSVDLYPGCDHTVDGADGCFTKFNNVLNYGGAPHMSGRKIVQFGLWLV